MNENQICLSGVHQVKNLKSPALEPAVGAPNEKLGFQMIM